MVNFFKNVGKGILYILFIPAIIVVLVVAAVGAVGVFFYELGKSIGLFFMGKNIFQDLPEDTQAKAIIEMNKNLSNQILAGGTPVQDVTNNTTTNNTYNNIIIMSNEEDLIKLMSGQSSIPENTNIRVIESEKPKEIIENEPLQIDVKEAEFTEISSKDDEIITNGEEKEETPIITTHEEVKRTPRPSIKPVRQSPRKVSETHEENDTDEDDDDIEPGGGVTIR
ncbi:MAG: hypothetical protein LUB56_01575 [Coprobacillus sp.]|nr:hypothetical protein [Coprobacillus sp.]